MAAFRPLAVSCRRRQSSLFTPALGRPQRPEPPFLHDTLGVIRVACQLLHASDLAPSRWIQKPPPDLHCSMSTGCSVGVCGKGHETRSPATPTSVWWGDRSHVPSPSTRPAGPCRAQGHKGTIPGFGSLHCPSRPEIINRPRTALLELTPAATLGRPAGEKKFHDKVAVCRRLQGDRSPVRALPTQSPVVQ